jgi:hypothetical protein
MAVRCCNLGGAKKNPMHNFDISKGARVLCLEDDEVRIAWFKEQIPEIVICQTVRELQALFTKTPLWDFLFLDHDLGEEETGADAARWLAMNYAKVLRSTTIIIHSTNLKGAEKIQVFLPNVFHFPSGTFTINKGEPCP